MEHTHARLAPKVRDQIVLNQDTTALRGVRSAQQAAAVDPLRKIL